MENRTINLDFDRVPKDIEQFRGKLVRIETIDHALFVGILSEIHKDSHLVFTSKPDNEPIYFTIGEITRFTVYNVPINTASETKPIKSEPKMSSIRFRELLDELDGNSLETLKEKNGRYAKNGDALHNFRKGAIMNRETLAQTCWGYMSKHLVALQDMVEFNDFSNREDFLEKCQDTINYIRFLWCIGNEETLVKTETFIDDSTRKALSCIDCQLNKGFVDTGNKVDVEIIKEAVELYKEKYAIKERFNHE